MTVALLSRERLFFGLKVAFSVAVLAVVVERTGVDAIVDGLTRVDPALLLLALGLDVANDLLSAVRLRVLAGATGRGLSVRDAIRFHYFGKFFNTLLPTNIGGDVYKAYRVGDRVDRAETGYSAVVVDRAVGVVTWTAVAVGGTVAARALLPRTMEAAVYGGAALLVFGTATAVAVARSPRSDGLLERLGDGRLAAVPDRVAGTVEAVAAFRRHRQALAMALALSLVFDAVLILINAVLAAGLGMAVPPLYFVVYVPVAAFLLFIPVSVKGFGVREALYLVFFTAAGATAGQAVALAILVHLLELIAAAVGGVLYAADAVSRPDRRSG